MKLNDILQEGLIKLPRKALSDMTKFFVKMYLAYYHDHIEEELVGKAYYEANKLADEVAREYDVEVDEKDAKRLSRQIKETFLINEDDLPYSDRLKKIYPNFIEELGLPIKIKMVLDFVHTKDDAVADFDPNDNTIRVAMTKAKLTNLEDEESRRDALNKNLTQAIGLIEHELTHAIQHNVLSRFHQKQIANVFDVANKKNLHASDNYANSQIEFDPWIKGEMAVFRSLEKEMKKLNTEYDRKLSLEYFVAARGASKNDYKNSEEMEKVMFTSPSVFFLSLKKHNPEQWKKAVKLFYQKV